MFQVGRANAGCSVGLSVGNRRLNGIDNQEFRLRQALGPALIADQGEEFLKKGVFPLIVNPLGVVGEVAYRNLETFNGRAGRQGQQKSSRCYFNQTDPVDLP